MPNKLSLFYTDTVLDAGFIVLTYSKLLGYSCISKKKGEPKGVFSLFYEEFMEKVHRNIHRDIHGIIRK